MESARRTGLIDDIHGDGAGLPDSDADNGPIDNWSVEHAFIET